MRLFKIKNTLIAVGLVALSSIAHAKSMPNWTGFYAGLNAGGIFNHADLNAHNLGFTNANGTCNQSTNFSSAFPGLQVGYAYQANMKVVLGVEADYTYNFNNHGNTACHCDVNPQVYDQFTIKNQQQGSVRGRIGYVLDHLLPYLMAGGSLANLGIHYSNEAGDDYSKNTTEPGWLVGVGFEWNLASPSWSLRAEYYYTSYRHYNMGIPSTYGLADPNGNSHINLNTNNLRLAVNYWF